MSFCVMDCVFVRRPKITGSDETGIHREALIRHEKDPAIYSIAEEAQHITKFCSSVVKRCFLEEYNGT